MLAPIVDVTILLYGNPPHSSFLLCPTRVPRTAQATREELPAVACMTMPPAKSLTPREASQPPPQICAIASEGVYTAHSTRELRGTHPVGHGVVHKQLPHNSDADEGGEGQALGIRARHEQRGDDREHHHESGI